MGLGVKGFHRCHQGGGTGRRPRSSGARASGRGMGGSTAIDTLVLPRPMRLVGGIHGGWLVGGIHREWLVGGDG